jgi:uncharacterized iron-regulated membrane protein
MDGSIWLYLAEVVALAVGAAIVVGLRRPSALEKSRPCPNCQTPMSMRRVSWFRTHLLFGVWECPHCGTRMKRRGRVVGAVTR